MYRAEEDYLKNIYELTIEQGKTQIKSNELAESLGLTDQSTNDKIKKLTGGDMDIAGIAFVTLLGLGIYQISRGNFIAPAWYTAFWYAMNIFLNSKNKAGE